MSTSGETHSILRAILSARTRTDRFGLETNMSRIALICCFTVLLASCGSIRSGVANVDIEHARQACAYLGITPGSSVFAECSRNLYLALTTAQSEAHE